MFHKNQVDLERQQLELMSLDMLVPQDHFLRKLEKIVDFNFIYDLLEDSYSPNQGRPSLDPVLLIKIPLLKTLYGIHSMRQTIREIEVNIAFRWFLGIGFESKVPHFSTYGKNYERRFKDRAVVEAIFNRILSLCFHYHLIDSQTLFIDGTHVKAAANGHKFTNQVCQQEAKFMAQELEEEIKKDRVQHGKKPLSPKKEVKEKDRKVSTTDPESGWFHKGEHKEVFAYNVEAACDQNGWILSYAVAAGNVHDSQLFPLLFAKLEPFEPQTFVMDSGFKTPSIAKFLLDQELTPVLPYTRPRGDKKMLRPKDFVYDEYYDCYLCPQNQVLSYSTTNREGYREYKSNPKICQNCPLLPVCTKSKHHQRVVERHVWKEYLERCEDIRHTPEMKEWYKRRKETIERDFGTAKEYHGMRYTRQIGKAKMEDQVGLTFACLNLKKLVKMVA